MENLEKLLTPRETAHLLGVDVRTLANWRCNGRVDIPYVKIGGAVRYDAADLAEWVEGRKALNTDGQAGAA